LHIRKEKSLKLQLDMIHRRVLAFSCIGKNIYSLSV